MKLCWHCSCHYTLNSHHHLSVYWQPKFFVFCFTQFICKNKKMRTKQPLYCIYMTKKKSSRYAKVCKVKSFSFNFLSFSYTHSKLALIHYTIRPYHIDIRIGLPRVPANTSQRMLCTYTYLTSNQKIISLIFPNRSYIHL